MQRSDLDDLGDHDKDHSMREATLVAPVAQGENDPSFAECILAYEKDKEHWERSDRVTLMIMDMNINPSVP